jgi:hypothetical protein
MADIDVVPKRRSSAWLWIAIAIVIAVILWMLLGTGTATRTGGLTIERPAATAVLDGRPLFGRS